MCHLKLTYFISVCNIMIFKVWLPKHDWSNSQMLLVVCVGMGLETYVEEKK